ncbi:LysM peptidoglycan-binding domain-containing protein [Rheinheimera riviphila]|uniref:LysM peptidoglycan-binding domain-containing protein n=1 Tax=Rheinheimera riviphila TaxID=1834037 RepID=A0A437QRK1_9GAMM|nr:LysM domain-containing protein [Rheinheimera riviphila]RVU37133.1 LysM peptidoglycan-binding domain-containing protein [Rheinheimera riviphila]
MANEDVDFTVQFDMRGTLMSMQQTDYNADGQVQKVTTHQLLVDMADAKLFNLVQQKITASGLMVNDGTVLNGQGLLGVSAADLTTTGSVTEYQNFNAAGLAERTVTRVTKPDDRNPGRTTVDELSWSRSYEKRDSLLESKVSGTAQSGSKGGQFKDASSYSQYDAHGNKVLVVEGNELQDSKFKVRQMLYAADGSLLRLQHSEVAKSGEADALTQVKNHLSQVRSGQAVAGRVQQESIQISSNGAYVGDVTVDRGETLPEEHWLYRTSIKDQHFNSGIERTDTQKHTVRAGDTLQSLAQLYYGNADYWYLIATANGISQSSAQSGPDSQLIEGTTLDIPQRANSFNAHNSFKPMDLQQIIGDTTPNVPYLPPPPPVGCNAMAMVVIIAVVVIATIATAGAAAAYMGPQAFSMALGASALTGGATVAGVTLGAATAATAAMSAGMIAATAAAASAVGGFAGSVAGQLAGKAMGIVDSFSLKNALASGLTAGATAGVGSMMGVGGSVNGTFVGGAKAAVGNNPAVLASLNTAGKMAMAASTVGLSVAANKLVGNNQASFQWRNVVIGAVSAGLMDKAGISNTKSVFEKFNEGAGLVSGFMEGVAGAAIGYGVSKVLYNEGSWNFRNVAIDAFGNALGNSIVAGLSSKSNAQNEKAANQRGQQAYEQAIAAGIPDTQAKLLAAKEVLASVSPGKRPQVDINETDDALSVSYLRGDKSKGGITLTNTNSLTAIGGLTSWISDEGLWGNNDVLKLATGLLDRRAEAIARQQRESEVAQNDRKNNGNVTYTVTLSTRENTPNFSQLATNWVSPYGQLRSRVAAHSEGFKVSKVENSKGKTYAHIEGSHAANEALGLNKGVRRTTVNNSALNKAVWGAEGLGDVAKAGTYLESVNLNTVGGRLGAAGLGLDAALEYADYKMGHGDSYTFAAGTVAFGAVMAGFGLVTMPILATGAILFGVGVGLGYGYDYIATKYDFRGNISDVYKKIGN